MPGAASRGRRPRSPRRPPGPPPGADTPLLGRSGCPRRRPCGSTYPHHTRQATPAPRALPWSRRAFASRRDALAQRRAEPLLFLAVQRGLDHVAAVGAEALQQLLRCRARSERDERRAPRGDAGAELLEEVVVDSRVPHLA